MGPEIYLFGDSITEMSFRDGGWLITSLARGYNTRWALKVIDKVFRQPENAAPPLAVTVLFGANDASLLHRCGGFQHVPLDEYKQNLHATVEFLKTHWPSTCIILITPPPIDEEGRFHDPYVENPPGLPERTNEAAGRYAKQCLTIASECGVPAIDLWTKMQQYPGWEKAYLSDGLHLMPEGNNVVFKEMIRLLRKNGISLETLPSDLPLITEVHRNNPLKSFDS